MSVVPAITCTGALTIAFAAGIQMVTDGLAGFKVHVCGLTPVPVSDTEIFPAVVVMLSIAERMPAAVGVNVTWIVQFAPAARLEQLLVWAKSPAALTLETVTDELVPLLTVTVCAALVVFTVWLVNVRLVGEAVTLPALAPVPLSDTERFPAVVVMLSVPERVPAAVGVNVTWITQLALAARLEQLFC